MISGIVLGVLIGLHPILNKSLQPIILALKSIPLLILDLIVLLPTFHLLSEAVIVIGSILLGFCGTINGSVLIEQGYFDNAMVMGTRALKSIL